MKNYFKLLILSFLSINLALFAMKEQPLKRKHTEETSQQQPEAKKLHLDEFFSQAIAGLPNEIWVNILQYFKPTFFDPTILDGANDIYEGVSIVQKHIRECCRLKNVCHQLSLICKTFKDIFQDQSQKWSTLKQEIKKFYIPQLNDRFLELEEDKLYPKGDSWVRDEQVNTDLASTIATGNMKNNSLLHDLAFSYTINEFILKLINVLLFYGADTERKDRHEQPPLLYALNFRYKTPGDTALIALLLEYGANPNTTDRWGQSALVSALRNAKLNAKAIELLLQYGANPNSGYNDIYPLHVALAHVNFHNPNTIDKIILLLKYGANPNLINNRGLTAFEVAQECNFNDFEELVKIYGQNLQ